MPAQPEGEVAHHQKPSKKGKKKKKPFPVRTKIGWKRQTKEDKTKFYVSIGLSSLSAVFNLVMVIWGFVSFGITNKGCQSAGNTKTCLYVYINNLFITIAIMELVSALFNLGHVGATILEMDRLIMSYITFSVYAFYGSCGTSTIVTNLGAVNIAFVVGGFIMWIVGAVLGFITFHFNSNLIKYSKEAIVGGDDDDDSEEEADSSDDEENDD